MGTPSRAAVPPALERALRFARCPRCGAELASVGGTVRCSSGHAFDVARQGYVNLAAGPRRPRGDTAAMVAARAEFLQAGHFDAIWQCVCERARVAGPRLVLDVGAGTGHLLARVLDALPDATGIALDSSIFAARRAARAHPCIAALVSDAWGALPIGSGAATLVLNAFAPRGAAEIARVLAPGGTVLVVAPTTRHLRELVGPLGLLGVDARKDQRLHDAFAGHLRAAGDTACEFALSLDHAAVARLVAMGPSAHHVDAATLDARIARLAPPLTVTASVTVTAFAR